MNKIKYLQIRIRSRDKKSS
ncbi:hypothetical protein CAJAP_08774 [Camponotus japonicus]